MLIFLALVSPNTKDYIEPQSTQILENSESIEKFSSRFECVDGLYMSTYGNDCDTPFASCDTTFTY